MFTDCLLCSSHSFQPFKITKCMHFPFTRHTIGNQGHITPIIIWAAFRVDCGSHTKIIMRMACKHWKLHFKMWKFLNDPFAQRSRSTQNYWSLKRNWNKQKNQKESVKKKKRSKNKINKRWKISHMQLWTLNTIKMSR